MGSSSHWQALGYQHHWDANQIVEYWEGGTQFELDVEGDARIEDADESDEGELEDLERNNHDEEGAYHGEYRQEDDAEGADYGEYGQKEDNYSHGGQPAGNILNLPSPPMYEPHSSQNRPHEAQTNLPEDFDTFDSPKAFFELFFSNLDFETLARNTNMYAETSMQGQLDSVPGSQL